MVRLAVVVKTEHSGVRRRVIAVALAFVSLDFVTKQLVVTQLEGQPPMRVVGDILRLWVGRNPGAAFSMGANGSTVLFTIIASAAVIGIGVYAPRMVMSIASPTMPWAVPLLMAGAAGNLLDRLLRAPGFGRGHVVDFIELPHFPIFNVSDMCITASVVLYLLASMSATRAQKRSQQGSASLPDMSSERPQ
jgi:signal peptidase II